MLLLLIGGVVSFYTLFCCRTVARTVPNNYILCGLFTISEAYCVAFIGSFYDTDIVLTAMWMTALIVTVVTIFAVSTKADFTPFWPIMIGICLSMIILLFVCCLVPFSSNFYYYYYCPFGAIFYTIYLIMDVQMLVGGKRYQFNEEDYIVAALCIYIDIVRIFIYVLRILGNKRR